MSARKYLALSLSVCLALLTACTVPVASPSPMLVKSAPTVAAPSAAALEHLPLYFVANHGQTDPQVDFYVPGKDNTIYFSPNGLTFAFTSAASPSVAVPAQGAPIAGEARPDLRVNEPAPQAGQRWAIKLDFVGANPGVQPQGEDQTAAVFSYFKGQPGQWQAGVPSYAQLRYPNLWSGIDLVYSGQGSQMKYEFEVQPGADPAQIQLAYRGASALRLTSDGQLEVSTPLNSFRDAAPVAYQMKDGQRVPVEMSYTLNAAVGAGPAATFGYNFHLGPYDHSLPLVLDPTIFVYAGYIGGANYDDAQAIAVDRLGNAYITGYTSSDQTSFPVKVGPELTFGGSYDAFVAKVNAAGTALVYAGYIGGSGYDYGYGISVDGQGNAYVTGSTNSDQTTFPVKIGPSLTYGGGNADAFVAKVNAAGTALDYAGYIGGDVDDYGYAIAVDGHGAAYITGATDSDQTSFPVKAGPGLTYSGGNDAFVAKVDPSGSALTYAGYIGGVDIDQGNGIAVDGGGNAYITGYTVSDQNTFPVKVGPALIFEGGTMFGDAFVAKVNTAGTALIYAGYIGGQGEDAGNGIAIDSHGAAYVTGNTTSDQTLLHFPVKVGPDLTYNGGAHGDAFVAKVNSAGSSLDYAGYIGGANDDFGLGIAVDTAGNAYVTGATFSDQTTFPVKAGPDLTYNGGNAFGGDAFVAKVNAAGSALTYAGYIGGSGPDNGRGIAVDSAGNAYITGDSGSDQNSFPVKVGPGLTYNGGRDAFVAKISSFTPSVFLYLPLVRR